MPGESAQHARLTLLGRTMLEQAGLTDEQVRKSFRKLDELHEAKKQKVFQHEGAIVLGPEQADNEVQLKAAVERLKIADAYPNKLEHEVHGSVSFNLLAGDWDGV